MQAQGCEVNGTPRKTGDQKKRKIKRRVKLNNLEPIVSEIKKVSLKPVQETKDLEW